MHGALARWQRAVDGGGRRSADALVSAVRAAATADGLAGPDLDRALHRLEPGLRSYAGGPWPRRATVFLEQPVRHVLVAPDGFEVALNLRVDRVTRYRRSIAIVDFKTVTPHAFEMRADEWQLRTYALAAPELVGVAPTSVHLFVIDVLAGTEHQVSADAGPLEAAAAGRG